MLSGLLQVSQDSRPHWQVVVLSTAFAGFVAAPLMWSISTSHSATKERSASHQSIGLSAFRKLEDQGLDVIVGLMDRKGTILVREFGALRNDGLGPEDTLVDIGSITKTVTAIAVLKLVEEGRLKLNETLSTFWPDVPVHKASISVHQLLTHTSGLPEEVGDDGEELTRDDFINRVLREDLVNAPGRQFHYSNVGYGILAAIVELRSGKSFEIYLAENVLNPVGLGPIGYETAYKGERSLLSPKVASTSFHGQTIRQASWGGHAPGWNLIGNGGLVTTPVTYLRFWSAVRQGRVLRKALLRQVLTPHIKEQGRSRGAYGYGLIVQDFPEHGRTYGHDGGNDLFSAEWLELSTTGLIIFTAGRGEDAIDAMRLIINEHRIPDRL